MNVCIILYRFRPEIEEFRAGYEALLVEERAMEKAFRKEASYYYYFNVSIYNV